MSHSESLEIKEEDELNLSNDSNSKIGLGKNYNKLATAVFLANLGEGVSMTALPWLATNLTSNPFYISLNDTASRLPWLLLSLPLGVLIDYVSRKKFMIYAGFIRACLFTLLAFIVFEEWASIPLLVTVHFFIGVTRVMYDSAAQTMIPLTVEKDQLEKANGNFVAVQMIANDILGKPIGGFLIALGLSIPFAFDAVTAFIAIPILISLQGTFSTHKKQTKMNFKRDILEGLTYVWKHPILRILAFISIGTTGTYAAVLTAQTLFVREILHMNSLGYGILLSLTAVGSIVASQSLEWLKRLWGAKTVMPVSLLSIGLCLGLAGISNHWSIVLVLYILASFSIVVWSAFNTSLRQRLIPHDLLGRVGAVFLLLSWGVSAIGMLFGGLLIELGEFLFDRDLAIRLPNFLLGIVYLVIFFSVLRLVRREDVE